MKDHTNKIKFSVTSKMVDAFIELTQDKSSLHTDKTFARRSEYRTNVVHGMIPVLFISTYALLGNNEESLSYKNITTRFIKPVFIGDTLEIEFLSTKNDPSRVSYSIKKTSGNTAVSNGSFTLDKTAHNNIPEKHNTNKNALIKETLSEQCLTFDDISKGDRSNFKFKPTAYNAELILSIISDGLDNDLKSSFCENAKKIDQLNLIATTLYSTFAGMCIPGKYATLTNFTATFDKSLKWNNEYSFEGEIAFMSDSTYGLVENISILDLEDNMNKCANGKINVKVNKPPVDMPTITSIEKSGKDLSIEGKTVLITGSSRGIGETTAKLFSVYGAKVVVNYSQSKQDADRVVNEILSNGGEAISVQADVSDRDQVKTMFKTVQDKYGSIDILVNNAVKDASPSSFIDLTWDDIQQDIDVTLKGAFNCTQEAVPDMIKNNQGKIINISSVFTDNPPKDQTKYVISKSAIVGLTKSLAIELAPNNIQVNMVVPSIVDTDLSKGVSKIHMEKMKSDTPMGRNAEPIDVARAVLFLASSLASFTTGQRVMVTGGNLPLL